MVARKAFPKGWGLGTGNSLTPTFGLASRSSHGRQAANVLSANLLPSEQGCSEAAFKPRDEGGHSRGMLWMLTCMLVCESLRTTQGLMPLGASGRFRKVG